MGPHWGDEGGLVFKDPSLQGGRPSQPNTSPSCQPALCCSVLGKRTPTLHCTQQLEKGWGEAISMAASPRLPIFPCPQLAKLIVPFSTRSQHWLTGFQSPLLPNYR